MLQIPKKTYSRRKKPSRKDTSSFLNNKISTARRKTPEQTFDINQTLPDDLWKDSFDKLKDTKTPLSKKRTPLKVFLHYSSSVEEIFPDKKNHSMVSTPILPLPKKKLTIPLSPLTPNPVGRKYFSSENCYDKNGKPIKAFEYSSELRSNNHLSVLSSGHEESKNNSCADIVELSSIDDDVINISIPKEKNTHRKYTRRRLCAQNSSKELYIKSNPKKVKKVVVRLAKQIELSKILNSPNHQHSTKKLQKTTKTERKKSKKCCTLTGEKSSSNTKSSEGVEGFSNRNRCRASEADTSILCENKNAVSPDKENIENNVRVELGNFSFTTSTSKSIDLPPTTRLSSENLISVPEVEDKSERVQMNTTSDLDICYRTFLGDLFHSLSNVSVHENDKSIQINEIKSTNNTPKGSSQNENEKLTECTNIRLSEKKDELRSRSSEVIEKSDIIMSSRKQLRKRNARKTREQKQITRNSKSTIKRQSNKKSNLFRDSLEKSNSRSSSQVLMNKEPFRADKSDQALSGPLNFRVDTSDNMLDKIKIKPSKIPRLLKSTKNIQSNAIHSELKRLSNPESFITTRSNRNNKKRQNSIVNRKVSSGDLEGEQVLNRVLNKETNSVETSPLKLTGSIEENKTFDNCDDDKVDGTPSKNNLSSPVSFVTRRNRNYRTSKSSILNDEHSKEEITRQYRETCEPINETNISLKTKSADNRKEFRNSTSSSPKLTKTNKRNTKRKKKLTPKNKQIATETNSLTPVNETNDLSETTKISNSVKDHRESNISTRQSKRIATSISNTAGSNCEIEFEPQKSRQVNRKTKSVQKLKEIGDTVDQTAISEPQHEFSNSSNLESNKTKIGMGNLSNILSVCESHRSLSNGLETSQGCQDGTDKANEVLNRSEIECSNGFTLQPEEVTSKDVKDISSNPEKSISNINTRKRKSKLSNDNLTNLETDKEIPNKKRSSCRSSFKCSSEKVASLHDNTVPNISHSVRDNEDVNKASNTSLDRSIDRNELLSILNNRTVSFNQTRPFPDKSCFRNTLRQSTNRSMKNCSCSILSSNTIIPETLREDLENLQEDINDLNESYLGELTLQPISLQPGKWRKSLCIWRRNNSIISENINESKISSARCHLSANKSNKSLMPTFCETGNRDFSKGNATLTPAILSRSFRSSRKTILDYSKINPSIPKDEVITSSNSKCTSNVLLLETTDDETSNLSTIPLLDKTFAKQNSNITLRRSKIVNSRSNCSKRESRNSNETSNERIQRYQQQLSVPLYRQPSISRRRRTSIVEDALPRIVGSPCDTDSLFAEFVRISPYEVSLRSQLNPRDIVLRRCNQSDPLSFSDEYSSTVLHQCRKIGEGVYGEVFMNKGARGEIDVLKIIPIEGCNEINGEPQKKFEEILSEIVIAMELSRLRNDKEFKTSGFVEVKKVRCVQGRYPDHLIDLWELYRENCGTENDHPEIFPDDQLYIVLELANGGQDLEAFTFQNALQSYSAFVQIALTLAVAENKFQFEHRDLHWGNILLAPTEEKELFFRINGKEIKIPTHGVKATIIDYTLSRMIFDGCCLYNDLSNDIELFSATGDYQFDIYRLMKKSLEDQWERFEPYTNVLWLHYTLDKMISGARYRCSKSKKHRSAIHDMMQLRDELLDYKSASDYVECLN